MKRLFARVGFALLTLGSSLFCIEQVSANMTKFYNDIDKSKEIVRNVDIAFSDFIEQANKVKDGMVEYSQSFNFYLDDFLEESIKLKEKINAVEQEIDNMNDNASVIIDGCNYEINNVNMESNCTNFKTNYLNMINSYDIMIEEYNKVVETYNKHAEVNGFDIASNYTSSLSERTNEIIKNLK